MDEIARITKHKNGIDFIIQDRTRKDNVKPTIIIPTLMAITFCGGFSLILLSSMVSALLFLIPVFGVMELASLVIFLPWLITSIWHRNKTYSGPQKTITLDDERHCIAISDFPPNDLLDTVIFYTQVNQITNHFEMVCTANIFYVLVVEIKSNETNVRSLLYRGIPSTRTRELIDAIIDRCKGVGGSPELIDEGSISDTCKAALQERKKRILDFVQAEFSAETRAASIEIAKGAFSVSDTESDFKLVLVHRSWETIISKAVLLALIPAFTVLLFQDWWGWKFISVLSIGLLAGFFALLTWMDRTFPPRSCTRFVHLNKNNGMLTILEKRMLHTAIAQHHITPGCIISIEMHTAVYVNTAPYPVLIYFSPDEKHAEVVASMLRKSLAKMQ